MKNQEHNSDTLIKVEGVSKKFCRSLKKSLWYGLQDMGRELTGRRHGFAHAGQRLKVKDHRPILPSSDPQPPAFSLQPSAFSPPPVISLLQPSAFSPQPSTDSGLRPKEFWAVKDVSFELKRGECLGLIGRNGAGKTTLLKMLNGLIKPDAGRIEMRGRVGALISLGAGFNGILTGRENIYTNASVLGLTKKETDAKLDEIIDFAEIGDFIDTPVQNYSSGMTVRLGFAVASSLNPDVLLLDEVLAVGDIGFMVKCLNRMRETLRHSAVIFVSHNMQFVSHFCTRILLMDKGGVACDTPSLAEGISQYLMLFKQGISIAGTGEASVENVKLHVDGVPFNDDEEAPVPQGANLKISYDIMGENIVGRRILTACTIKDMGMDAVLALVPDQESSAPICLQASRTSILVDIGSVMLNASKYTFVIFVEDAETNVNLARLEGVGRFRVTADKVHWGRTIGYAKIAVVK